MKKILQLLFCLSLVTFLFLPKPSQAVTSLNNVSLEITPQNAGSLSSWKISFVIPANTKIGHILISLGGYQPDLSSAELFVTGLPQGNPQVGKSNINCVSNCDDIRYFFNKPIDIAQNTKIIFTLNKVKNPELAVQTGLNFIDVFSSQYPQLVLAFSSGEKLITLENAQNLPEENLIPQTATSEAGTETLLPIQKVQINQLFFKAGAKTTKLSEIKDASKVEDLTFDLLGKVEVNFTGPVDLSKPEAVSFIDKLGDYMVFDNLHFVVKKELMDYFKVPLRLTFYQVPYVWDPDILKDNIVLTKDKIENYNFASIDEENQVTFLIKEAGDYKLIPHFELYLTDNQEIKNKANPVTLEGRISDGQAGFKINLNDLEIKADQIQLDPKTGQFSFAANLNDGPNLIKVEATSSYSDLQPITKIIQYFPIGKIKETGSPQISPANFIAIGIAIILIILIYILVRMSKKKKR
ncbi:MAG: hypothetical protein NTX00_01580 [Candidatus Parcubacteria bacterium]|nr:hypothetical protein [Candidatus Parcubacteria bacterium]